jgi:hypothetical protein
MKKEAKNQRLHFSTTRYEGVPYPDSYRDAKLVSHRLTSNSARFPPLADAHFLCGAPFQNAMPVLFNLWLIW